MAKRSERMTRCSSERAIRDTPSTSSWAIDLQQLLTDPVGVEAFSEFLKREFSYENIEFWLTCESFKKIRDVEEMKSKAKEIYYRYICVDSTEPVNIDHNARQIAKESVEDPHLHMFVPAQQQIFNLLKFDSYKRFVASDIFKECEKCELMGIDFPFKSSKSTTLLNVADVRQKRHSLIPWSRSKSKPKSCVPTMSTASKANSLKKGIMLKITDSVSKRKESVTRRYKKYEDDKKNTTRHCSATPFQEGRLSKSSSDTPAGFKLPGTSKSFIPLDVSYNSKNALCRQKSASAVMAANDLTFRNDNFEAFFSNLMLASTNVPKKSKSEQTLSPYLKQPNLNVDSNFTKASATPRSGEVIANHQDTIAEMSFSEAGHSLNCYPGVAEGPTLLKSQEESVTFSEPIKFKSMFPPEFAATPQRKEIGRPSEPPPPLPPKPVRKHGAPPRLPSKTYIENMPANFNSNLTSPTQCYCSSVTFV